MALIPRPAVGDLPPATSLRNQLTAGLRWFFGFGLSQDTNIIRRARRRLGASRRERPLKEQLEGILLCVLQEPIRLRDNGRIRGMIHRSVLLLERGLTGRMQAFNEVMFPDSGHYDRLLYGTNPPTRSRHSLGFFCDPRLLLQWEVTQKLVRYGATLALTFAHWQCVLTRLVWYIEHKLLREYFGMKTNYEEILSDSAYRYPENKRRLYVVLLMIVVTIWKQPPFAFNEPTWVFKLVFNTTGMPFVHMREIRRVLTLALRDGDQKERKIRKFCQIIAKEFPHTEEPPRPRSLMHLSRRAVRNRMGDLGTLPHGIKKLPIPNPLKSYIMLQPMGEFHLNSFPRLKKRR